MTFDPTSLPPGWSFDPTSLRLPAPPPRMDETDVGEYYIRDDGTVWRLVSYAAKPTALLQRVDDPADQVRGCVGARIFAGFRKLEAVDA